MWIYRESVKQTPNKIHPLKYSLLSSAMRVGKSEFTLYLLLRPLVICTIHPPGCNLLQCSAAVAWVIKELIAGFLRNLHNTSPTLRTLYICCLQRFTSKQDVIRHYNMHKKRDNSLQHGFMRFSPLDDCSVYYHGCHLNGKSTHYHCMQVNHSKNP